MGPGLPYSISNVLQSAWDTECSLNRVKCLLLSNKCLRKMFKEATGFMNNTSVGRYKASLVAQW